MRIKQRLLLMGLTLSVLAAVVVGTSLLARPDDHAVLIVGAYTTPREALEEVIGLFEADWVRRTGRPLEVAASYLGSGAQSRAIVGGFEADVAFLSLAWDIDRVRQAGLITHDWRRRKYGGFITRSVVALAVRPGNPQGVRDWADILRPELELLAPNPKTSGGAQWNFLAVYGAARRGYVPGYAGDDAGARSFARAVFRNVLVLDKGARESIINFERGLGDVAVTYENEIHMARRAGQKNELVIPRSTIGVENPAALIDVYVDRHGRREEAEAFLDFLESPVAQRVFARGGFRSVDPVVAAEFQETYPPVEDLWTVDYFGGWARANERFFRPGGDYEQILNEVHAAR